MAAHGNTSDQHSSMDIGEHVRTWKAFTGLIKWSMSLIGLVMLFLLIFRTH
jgi:hypothetical protein